MPSASAPSAKPIEVPTDIIKLLPPAQVDSLILYFARLFKKVFNLFIIICIGNSKIISFAFYSKTPAVVQPEQLALSFADSPSVSGSVNTTDKRRARNKALRQSMMPSLSLP